MKSIIIALALLLAANSYADQRSKRAGKVVLAIGLGTLALLPVYGALFARGNSDACYAGATNNDGCEGMAAAGLYGMAGDALVSVTLLAVGGGLYASGSEEAAPAKLATIRF